MAAMMTTTAAVRLVPRALGPHLRVACMLPCPPILDGERICLRRGIVMMPFLPAAAQLPDDFRVVTVLLEVILWWMM